MARCAFTHHHRVNKWRVGITASLGLPFPLHTLTRAHTRTHARTHTLACAHIPSHPKPGAGLETLRALQELPNQTNERPVPDVLIDSCHVLHEPSS